MMAVQERRKPQRHILVVDDDRLVLAALADGLRGAGYRVTGAASGEEALAIAGRDAPDLALLDVRMPGMSGIELGRRLREQFSVPFLYHSAYGDQDVVQQAVEEGALGCLVKPLDIQQIVPSIEAALTRAHEMKKLHETETQLNAALAGSREISMVVGLLCSATASTARKHSSCCAATRARNGGRSPRLPANCWHLIKNLI